MKTFRLNYLILCLLCCTTAIAQTKKLEKTYKTNSNVVVTIDASHANVEVEHWDRNEVQVEAFLETKEKRKQELQKLLDNWKLDTRGTAGKVNIISKGSGAPGSMDMSMLNESLAKLPEMLEPLNEMMGPLLESISNNPLPPQFYESMGDLKFDYEAYRKEGDTYMERWEKQVEKSFGKDFEKSMEKWAAQFEKDTAIWKKNLEKNMEVWGEDFGKSMEAWGEDFGKSMEVWGDNFGKQMEQWAAGIEKQVESQPGDRKGKVMVINGNTVKGNKIIRIKMPKDGQLKLNVRHGEVKLGGITNNLDANLSHSRLAANTLSGRNTNVKVAYSPVKVRQWNYGVLNASYVQELVIDKAVSIKLNSNSSDVRINQLTETGVLKGTFGELVIGDLSPGFKNLDVTLENSDLELSLPNSAYTLNYNGSRSRVKYPQNLNLNSSESYDSQRLKGYNKNRNANAAINITASFSEVLLK